MALDKLTIINNGGLSTTSDYRVGVLTATKFVGPIEGGSATFAGNVSIGGTLTYEDVTNIDSVGIITARDGIDCNADLDVDGHTNLDNVSISGITTTGDIIIEDVSPRLQFLDTNADADEKKWDFKCNPDSKFVIQAINDSGSGGGSLFKFTRTGNNVDTFEAQKSGTTWLTISNVDRKLTTRDLDVTNNLDVDGHTNLDNVSIAGVSTFAGNLTVQKSSATDTKITVESTGTNSYPTFRLKNDARSYDLAIDGATDAFRIYDVTGTIERLRIANDGRIGINDTTPSDYELDIRKRSTATDAQIRLYNNETGSSNDTVMRYQIGGTSASNYIYFGDIADGNVGMVRYSHNTDHMSVHTNGSEAVRITSDGKVGIGTDDPDSLLHVSGSGIPTIKLEDTDTAGGYAHFEVNGEALFIESYDEDGTQGQILFKNATDEVMRIRSGKVGIGTDNPSNPLHITGADPQIKIQDSANGNNAKIFLDGPNSNLNFDWDSGSDRKINLINSGGGDISVGIGLTNPAGKLHISSQTSGDCELIIEADTDNNAEGDNPRVVFKQDGGQSTASVGVENNELYLAQSASAGGRGIIFKTGTATGYTNATEKMRLNEQGRLGIGTDNPTDILDVYSTTDPTIRSRSGSSSVGANIEICGGSSSDSQLILSSGTTSKYQFFRDGSQSDDLRIYDSANSLDIIRYRHGGYLHFGVNGQERLRIDSSGDVFMGGLTSKSSESNAILSINGGASNIGILNVHSDDGENVGDLSGITFSHGGGTNATTTARPKAAIALRAIGSYGRGDLCFYVDGTGDNNGVSAADEKIRIRSNGDVLINRTTSMDVASSAASKLQVHHGAGNISASFSSNADAIGPGGVLALGHSRSTDTGVLQDDDVLGQIRFAGADGTDLETQGALISAEVNGTPSSNVMPTDLVFSTNAGSGNVTERMRINKAGFVNIGSGSPVSKLTVDGNIYFSNGALISNFDSNGTAGGNIDHIWHSDAANYGRGGTWNFVSDGAFKGSGQSTIQIGYLANVGGGHFLNNVGIGITTVARGPLHVHENSSNDCQIHLTNNDTGSTSGDGLTIFTDTDTSGIWSRENVDFQIATNGVERMRITNDGRVDIGGTNEVQLTSNSNYMLYLHGAIVGSNLDFCYGQRILLDDDDTGTTTADRERGSLYCDFNGNASGGNTTDETRIWNIYSDVDVTADYDLVYGLYSDIKTTHTSGTISEMRGVYSLVQSANSGDVTNMTGLYGLVQTTTGASTDTVTDMVGVRGRVNQSAGTSTANAVDIVGVWGNIDNDNNVTQASGGKCALFYGNYDKTTGLHNPSGIRIDTDVPNYFRGGLALGGGGNFLPEDDHMLHIQNQQNARGILLRQTGNNYNVIKGQANRTNANNAIVDLQGWWDTTQVARIRIDSGTDTSNKDDGKIEFATASAGSITDRMIIQANGEIAMKSNATPTDAIANLHVQNGTFRVSQSSGPTTEYLQITTHTHGTDGDRHAMRYVSGGTNYMSLSKNGQLGTLHHHYAGRTRSDANAPTNYYAHGSFGFYAYAGRTDDTSNYRTLSILRAWEGGDTEDRNFMYYVDSTSDTTTVDYDQHQRFGIKASGMLQSREDGWFGRCESDEASPNSVYTASNTNLVRTWANNGEAQTYMQSVAAPANNIYSFYVETGTSDADDDIQFRIRSSDGRISSDSGAIGTPGDYAECFEWLDGNPSNEDRVGISVVLVGDKIRPANSSDDPSKIIGIVSANPVVVGDAAPLKYHDRYLKDDWGRYIMEDVEMLVWNTGEKEYQPKQTDTFALQNCAECIEVSDIDAALAEGRIKQWVVDQNLRRMDKRRKVNPNFDVTKKDIYKPRLERPEWDAIGMVGKVYMRKGQPTGTNWIKLSDKTASIERWLVR